MTERDKVFDLINVERTYQDSKWGGREHDTQHSAWEWAHLMQQRLALADNFASEQEVLEQIRKVAAMAVACMEVFDTPPRVLTENRTH